LATFSFFLKKEVTAQEFDSFFTWDGSVLRSGSRWLFFLDLLQFI